VGGGGGMKGGHEKGPRFGGRKDCRHDRLLSRTSSFEKSRDSSAALLSNLPDISRNPPRCAFRLW